MTVRIEIDLNQRTSDNLVPAWREDADGDMAVGDTVTVFESEDNVCAPAVVRRVFPTGRVHLQVYWPQLTDDKEGTP